MTDLAPEIAPDDFWYICNASQYQIANLVPLIALGVVRCSGAAILVGRSDGGATDTDRTQSIEPASRLKAAIEALAFEAGEDIPVVEIGGDPHDEESWEEPIQRFLSERRPEFIVYNYSGGTRATLLAGVFAFLPGENRSSAIVAYAPARPPGRKAQLRQIAPERHVLDIEGDWTLPLGAWCALMGYRVVSTRDKVALRRELLTRRLAERVFEPSTDSLSVNDKLRILNLVFERVTKNCMPFANGESLSWIKRSLRRNADAANDWLWACLEIVASAESGLGRKRDGRWHSTNQGISYIKGGWFEEYVFLVTREFFADAGVGVHVGVDLQPDDRSSAHRDLDVAIMKGSQLHVLECKTGLWERAAGVDSSRVTPRTIRVLAEYRSALLGPYGRIALASAHGPDHKAPGTQRILAEARKLSLDPPIAGNGLAEKLNALLASIRDSTS